MKQLIFLSTLALSAVALGGCASSGFQRAENTSASLQKAAQSLDETVPPLDAVLVALFDLVNNPGEDIGPQFRTYDAAVKRMEAQANTVTRYAVAMEKEGLAYFQKWNQERETIQNSNLRGRSLDRKLVVAAQFEDARSNYAQTQAALDPFVADLKDISMALSSDLTPGGLNTIRSLASKANRNGPPLRESLVNLSREFETLGASLSSFTPEA